MTGAAIGHRNGYIAVKLLSAVTIDSALPSARLSSRHQLGGEKLKRSWRDAANANWFAVCELATYGTHHALRHNVDFRYVCVLGLSERV